MRHAGEWRDVVDGVQGQVYAGEVLICIGGPPVDRDVGGEMVRLSAEDAVKLAIWLIVNANGVMP